MRTRFLTCGHVRCFPESLDETMHRLVVADECRVLVQDSQQYHNCTHEQLSND